MSEAFLKLWRRTELTGKILHGHFFQTMKTINAAIKTGLNLSAGPYGGSGTAHK